MGGGLGYLKVQVMRFLSSFLLFMLGVESALAMPPQTPPANTIKELKAQMNRCIDTSSLPTFLPDMQVTARFSLRRDGSLIGVPRITFVSTQANPQTRDLYGQSLIQALQKCAPFVMTPALGGAMAGRMHAYRVIFVGTRPKGQSL
jgi:hypothetical protein